MDKPTSPAGQSDSNSPWPEDSISGQGFGATGIFGAVNSPEPGKGPPDSSSEPDLFANRVTDAAKPQPVFPSTPQPASTPTALAEPVVHRVVFGSGAAENSPELLDRMRMASVERAAAVEKPPAAEAGSKGSGGFTELLRALGSEPPAAPVAARETPHSAQDFGFTSMLRTLGTAQAPAAQTEDPMRTGQPAGPFARSSPADPTRASAASVSSGFTELLRATHAGASEFGVQQGQGSGLGGAPVAGGAAGVVPAPFESKPGAFTQMFNTLGGADPNPPVPAPPDRGSGIPARGGAGSFTEMLSLVPPSAAGEPPFREERKPSAGGLDYSPAPGTASPLEANRDPFSSLPLPGAEPIQNAPPGSGVGMTQLMRMLDEPSKATTPRLDAAPASAPSGTPPGIRTQTFASLESSNEPGAPAAKAPDWASPQAAPGQGRYPFSREASFQARQNVQPVSPPPAAPGASGASLYTQIIDASRMREQSMRGGAAAVNAVSSPPPPQSFGPIPPSVPMPNYPVPMPPAAGGMSGMGGMPQPGGFVPPQVPNYPMPGYPMNAGPHAGGMPAMGGSMPQAPGMYAPSVPVPPVPQAPPVRPPDPAAGKTQQILLIMGVVIIVLLVAILVTVVFLMKH